MPSAVILSDHSYPALLLAQQQFHQWLVHPGPLVLGATPYRPELYHIEIAMTRKVVPGGSLWSAQEEVG